MSVDLRDDPILGSNFTISLIPSPRPSLGGILTIALTAATPLPIAGFSECTGLDMALEIQEYAEGGRNDSVLRFPTRVKPANLTLKKGLTSSTDLWDWFNGFLQGMGKRQDGVITMQNGAHQPHTVWGFKRGLPVKYSGPQLQAAHSNVAVEGMEIAHEGLFQMSSNSSVSAAIGQAVQALNAFV